ncbi:MAG: hypothetical protein PHG16_10110 [Lachnospiraceae bacterium]|nr:hypothetical protein [Lachnospiraceae bacterium]
MGANKEEMFKTTLMGGFDKDDVVDRVTRMKDEAYAEKTKLLNTVKEKDKKIAELTARLEQKSVQVDTMEREIKEKYQRYIDNYESIGRLVFDAQMRADSIIKDAEEKREIMMEQAQEASTKCLETVQKEVDEKLAEGKKKYIAMQEELNEIVDVMNQVQRRFMESCKSVYNIISTMPESLSDLEDDIEEEGDEDQPENAYANPLSDDSGKL